jgi:hypothetical protein
MKMLRVTSIVVMCLFAAIAVATSGAHFFSASGSILDNGQLAVSFDESGLGQQTVNYTLSGNADYLWGCINGGSNHPQATNKETESTPVSSNTSFEPKNGRVQATIITPATAPEPPSTFSCPSGQTLVLASATYTGVVLTDTTNGVSISQADMTGSFTKTFFSFKK